MTRQRRTRNFRWGRPMLVGPRVEIDLNRCRNEEVIVKCNFGWLWPMWAGPWAPGLVMGPCIVEIDLIVIRDVKYQFEVNRFRNKDVNEIIDRVVIRDWAWSMWAGRPRVGNGTMHSSSANSVGGDSDKDGRTDNHNIVTLLKAW
ncbi:hypothetical protein DPMN_139726 [Dreissena polymorpha]|uniref:Uncharacterized protein n=1 Tax=Dreissena polymorpha TaxID=45954 RepID=A0A9D4G9I8_DREPO|nr:hypothetical protein DPMN_139726 [Dreissena polymorpha]